MPSYSNVVKTAGEAVADFAFRYEGYTEERNNGNLFGSYFGVNNQPWCSLFIMYCCAQTGVTYKPANASASSWKNVGSWVYNRVTRQGSLAAIKRGDVVMFDFGHGYDVEHVGLATGTVSGNYLPTIEGNTSGFGIREGVFTKRRSTTQIKYVIRLQGTGFLPDAPTNYTDAGSLAAGPGGPFSDTDWGSGSFGGQRQSNDWGSGSFGGQRQSNDWGSGSFDGQRQSSIRTEITYKNVEKEIQVNEIKTANTSSDTRNVGLLQVPTLVESPFIMLKIGDYTFGSYTQKGSIERRNSQVTVDFPNYMTSMSVMKVNGTVNQYTIQMEYQIQAGDDPNRLDKIFSSVGYGTVKISYGDWTMPQFIYKEEEAIITNLRSNINFQNSKISYTLSCTSNSAALAKTTRNYPKKISVKPSDEIFKLLYADTSSGLLNVFQGMKDRQFVIQQGYIPTNDKQVDIPAKNNIDPISYLNYLVSYMTSNTNSSDAVIQDSSYYMIIDDNIKSTAGGAYFRIVQVQANGTTLNTPDTYEVDVGFPENDLVVQFSLDNDSSWDLIYNYTGSIDQPNYVYKIDNNGLIFSEYSPNISTSNIYYRTTEADRTWWTKMTQFPITATLQIKGLLRPAMLMSYVRINSLFYGQKHISSGLYIITKQVDTINERGYRTTLNLTRIAGDQDFIETSSKKIMYKVPIISRTEEPYTFNSALDINSGTSFQYANEFNAQHLPNYGRNGIGGYLPQVAQDTNYLKSKLTANVLDGSYSAGGSAVVSGQYLYYTYPKTGNIYRTAAPKKPGEPYFAFDAISENELRSIINHGDSGIQQVSSIPEDAATQNKKYVVSQSSVARNTDKRYDYSV